MMGSPRKGDSYKFADLRLFMFSRHMREPSSSRTECMIMKLKNNVNIPKYNGIHEINGTNFSVLLTNNPS